ncbi:MAG: amino acid permease [Bryobacterales bacterium]|nr:amino acid permease [Bryobacterales bacterium]
MSELPRKLTLLDATTIVAGTIIGAGIFLVPSALAREVPSTPAILAVWLLAGVVSMLGAFAYAELGAMMPASGGQYVYLREAYGPLPAFLAGWTFFLVIQSGSTAAVSTGCALYLAHFFPGLPIAPTAITIILSLTLINYLGIRGGANVQILFTALKLSGLGLLIVSALFYPHPTNMSLKLPETISSSGLGIAFLAAFIAYDGWHVIAFVGGEVMNPKRNIPLSLVLGLAASMVVYLLANIAYLHVLPMADLVASPRVAADTALRTIGPYGAGIMTLTIVLSTIGAANGSILTAPRIYFAQARDGLFFKRFGDIHPKYQTPGFSILVQGVWCSILAASGSYEQLVAYVLFIAWIFHAATVLAVPRLRRKRPDAPRPYRMWGYPAAPYLFAIFAFWFVASTLYSRPMSSVFGAVLLLSGIPVYYHWRKSSAK